MCISIVCQFYTKHINKFQKIYIRQIYKKIKMHTKNQAAAGPAGPARSGGGASSSPQGRPAVAKRLGTEALGKEHSPQQRPGPWGVTPRKGKCCCLAFEAFLLFVYVHLYDFNYFLLIFD